MLPAGTAKIHHLVPEIPMLVIFHRLIDEEIDGFQKFLNFFLFFKELNNRVIFASEMFVLLNNIVSLCSIQKDHVRPSEGSVSKSGLYRLLRLVKEHEKENAWILPKLAYFFGRFKPREQYAMSWARLKEYVFSNRANWRHLELALIWCFMMMRREGSR